MAQTEKSNLSPLLLNQSPLVKEATQLWKHISTLSTLKNGDISFATSNNKVSGQVNEQLINRLLAILVQECTQQEQLNANAQNLNAIYDQLMNDLVHRQQLLHQSQRECLRLRQQLQQQQQEQLRENKPSLPRYDFNCAQLTIGQVESHSSSTGQLLRRVNNVQSMSNAGNFNGELDCDRGFSASNKYAIRTVDQLKLHYHDLGNTAQTTIYSTLRQSLPKFSEARLTEFICSLMLLAYQSASAIAQNLNELKQPLSKVSQMEHISLFNNSSEIRYSSQNNESEHLQLVKKHTVDAISRDYTECMSSLTLSTVNQFINSSCNLAWIMATWSRPIGLAAEAETPFDPRLHMIVNKNKPPINAFIDYFIWPILFEKDSDNILYKGLVII